MPCLKQFFLYLIVDQIEAMARDNQLERQLRQLLFVFFIKIRVGPFGTCNIDNSLKIRQRLFFYEAETLEEFMARRQILKQIDHQRSHVQSHFQKRFGQAAFRQDLDDVGISA